MTLLDTLNDFAKNVTDYTSGQFELTKLYARISGLKSVIKEAEEKLGKIYYEQLSENTDDIPEEAKAHFDQIKQTKEDIEEMEARIAAIKAAAANPLDPGKKRCENCGAVISVKSKFCHECGAQNIVPEAEHTEAPNADIDPETVEDVSFDGDDQEEAKATEPQKNDNQADDKEEVKEAQPAAEKKDDKKEEEEK
ncbi:MAG: zinc ribbon domain-containing protein [Eubacteriaceae bacterium]|nr:zinc ribbon domain-containing protein [Eubacteriaceae bacterium]